MKSKKFTDIKRFITHYLKKLGLSDDEACIFYAVLEKGQLTILEISRATKIERTKIYTIVQHLLERGILEESFDYKRRFIRTCDLSKLEFILDRKVEQAQSLEQAFNSFKSYVSYFKKQYNPTSVKFYRGINGIKQMLWNELTMKKKVLYAFTYRHLGELLGMKFARKLAKEYIIRGITVWDIQSKEFIQSLNKKYFPGVFKTKARYISPDILDIPIAIDMYDDMVVIFNWYQGELFGVEIRSDKFADFMKQVFKIVWKLSTKEGVR